MFKDKPQMIYNSIILILLITLYLNQIYGVSVVHLMYATSFELILYYVILLIETKFGEKSEN